MRVGDVKAGAADDSVDRMLQAILGDDAIFLHLTNMLGNDSNVGLRYGWIEVVGEQDALAAHDVVGCEPGPEFGILDLLGQMLTGKLHAQLHFVGMVDQRIRRGFEAHIDSGADVELNQRQERGMGRSLRGMIQGGVRWKRVRWETRGWMCGTNWMADAPVPITATRLPVRS